MANGTTRCSAIKPHPQSSRSSCSQFLLVDVEEAQSVHQEQQQRREGRLARLWGRRRAAAAPAAAGAGAAEPLANIPILSLSRAPSSGSGVIINPLGDTQPPEWVLGSASSAAEEGRCGAAAGEDAAVGTWLQAQPWMLPSNSSSSMCSGISICSPSDAGSAGGSTAHSRGSSRSWPQDDPACGRPGAGSSPGGSSGSRLVNLLMLQAEPGGAAAPPQQPLAPPFECTPNPLVAQHEQAALLRCARDVLGRSALPAPALALCCHVAAMQMQAKLNASPASPLLRSWRRHALQPERRQPELLRRLLPPGLEDEEAGAPSGVASPLPFGGGMASAGRGNKAALGRLLAVIVALAVGLLLLHWLHSNAVQPRLAQPVGLPTYGEAAVAGGSVAFASRATSRQHNSGSTAKLQPDLLEPARMDQPNHNASALTSPLVRGLRSRHPALLLNPS